VAKLQLTRPERKFLSRVSRAVFANPFSDERFAADSEIIDIDPSASYEERRQKRLSMSLSTGLTALQKRGKMISGNFQAKTAHLSRTGFSSISISGSIPILTG
jgi:hypothetical protein